tara:strand:+ start:358 stop:576 length:219 start_codon:yes stop_codon:yes gene_type:complete
MSKLIETENQIGEKIEAIIDASSANYVLNSIVQIAWGKADHLRTNWQDKSAAKEWENLALKLETLADKFETL